MRLSEEFKYLFYSLRPTHWIKNALIFLPLIFSEKFLSRPDVWTAATAFLAFCFLASGVYLINDLVDLPFDKTHPIKRIRPLASGRVSPKSTLIALVTLLVCSFILAININLNFLAALLFYLILNLLYSFFLQHLVIIDVMILASFYVIRVLAGLVAIEARLSEWMIICVGLLALFISFNKRRQELMAAGKDASSQRPVLRKYNTYFIDQMIGIVTAGTVVCYSIFAIDVSTVERFGTRSLILTVPFVYYGIFRYLYLVHHRNKGGDPVRIFLSDKMLILNILIWVGLSAFLIYTKI